MRLPVWQFITQGKSPQDHLHIAQEVVAAGCPWVQVRIKGEARETILGVARALLPLCREKGCLLTINDDIRIAREVGADGVHLGLQDMPPSQARELWPDCPIIGGTANTWADVQYMHRQGVDYIGLGPFRFTSTKERLSPVLGKEGYQIIMGQMAAAGIPLPVFAIGGIGWADISGIMAAGVRGIAVSGMVARAADVPKTVQALNQWFANYPPGE